jgi:hypothetical protein
MKTDPDPDELTPSESDLAVSFYDFACDNPNDTFEEVAARMMPNGKCEKSTEAFKREAQRMSDLAKV